jgi:hypothetical protein
LLFVAVAELGVLLGCAPASDREQTQGLIGQVRAVCMIQWNQLPGMRHGEYCDAHGHRLVVEAARWHPPALGNHRVEEYHGFIGGVRVGTWPDLEQAKRETEKLARRRSPPR